MNISNELSAEEQTRRYLEWRNDYRKRHADYDKYSGTWIKAVALFIEESAEIVQKPKKRGIKIFSIPFISTDDGKRWSKELEIGFCYGLPLKDVVCELVENIERAVGCELIHSARNVTSVRDGKISLEEKIKTIVETGVDPDRLMGEIDRRSGTPTYNSFRGSRYLEEEFKAYGVTNHDCKDLPFVLLSYREDKLLPPGNPHHTRNLYFFKSNPRDALVGIMKFYNEKA